MGWGGEQRPLPRGPDGHEGLAWHRGGQSPLRYILVMENFDSCDNAGDTELSKASRSQPPPSVKIAVEQVRLSVVRVQFQWGFQWGSNHAHLGKEHVSILTLKTWLDVS